MGTRCVVTFKGGSGEQAFYSVYKHWDGNPSNILELLNKAKDYAWKLPRFEASEFACAFIVAAKHAEGDVYLTSCSDAHGDLSYSYYVSVKDGKLFVTAYDFRGATVYNDFLDKVIA